MNSYRHQTLRRYWRTALTVTVAAAVWWQANPSPRAQESESLPLITTLALATTPQPAPLLSSLRDRPNLSSVRDTGHPIPSLTPPRRTQTDAAAWDKFEADFRPAQRSPSSVKRQLETVKYGLDTTVFALDRFVKSVGDHADFELKRGRLQRTRTDAREGFLDNPRAKLDLALGWGKPYIGVRVIVPFGK